MLAADGDYSSQQFALIAANGNADVSDCKLVHWFWFVEDLQSIRIEIFFGYLFIAMLFSFAANAVFYVTHNQNVIFLKYNVWGYERAVHKHMKKNYA